MFAKSLLVEKSLIFLLKGLMRQYLTKISSFTFKTNRVLSFGKVSLIITKISPSFAKGAAFCW